MFYSYNFILLFLAIAVASSLLYIHKYTQLWPKNDHMMPVSYFLIMDYFITSITFTLSVIYHTFMCHHGGKKVYDNLLKLDVIGVWFLSTFGTIPMMYTTFYRFPGLRLAIILGYILVSVIAMVILLTGNSRQHRAIAFTTQYVLRLFILGCRFSPLAVGVANNSLYYLLLEALHAFGVAINVLHFPERLLPGGFDYFCNGHQLMHISSTLSLFVLKTAFIKDIEWLNNQP